MTNSKTSRFRVQAGALVFEIEGAETFIQDQIAQHQDHIAMILEEQAKMIKSGKIPAEVQLGRRKSVIKTKTAGAAGKGRRPGRQPVIVRDSQLELKVRQLSSLKHAVETLANGTRLGKDATVFIIAYQLCKDVLGSDTFTAGDVINAYSQLGDHPLLPKANSVDVVQMLRNLAATSIGKEWVSRNADGTFSLTAKGRAVAESGTIIRRRGRRPAEPSEPVKKVAGRRGRPPKAVTEVAAETETPAPKKRGPKPGAKKAAGRRGRPPKAMTQASPAAETETPAPKKRGPKPGSKRGPKPGSKKTRGRKAAAKKKA